MRDWNALGRRGALALTLAIGLAAAPAHAQNSGGQVVINVLTPLGVVQIDDLDFGMIIPAATPGSVTINRNDGTCTPDVVILSGTDCRRAEFFVLGDPNVQVQISHDSAPITLTRQGGGATMVMDQLRHNGGRNKRLDAAGELTFYMGGRLQVGANQAPGTYDANFTVTVEYR